ncbi:SPFH domain-containing protein [Hydrogenophaga sp.]|uniref:SPFH domain-containing protein n=1 Tax=Hydrogenophaga sp. TaxID=1904254 RepID=UPI0035B397AD
MLLRLKTLTRSTRLALARWLRGSARPVLLTLGTVAIAGGAGWTLVKHPPVQPLEPGQLALRTNNLTGETSVWHEGPVWVLPGVHQFTTLSLQDRTWTAAAMATADGAAPAQTVEGLSIGMDLRVRYAIDPSRVGGAKALSYPKDIDGQIVEPAVQATVYTIVARHTVREIFSSQRAQIEQDIEAQIRERLKTDGLLLRSVHIGKIDLPEDYRKGMEVLLTEGLSAEKMRYTLELREKQVKESELTAEADKARREVAAEAAAREQVIAAKAQEEAMKHVLPLKQRQIEQRQLEAEATRVARVKQAEGEAQARRIEAEGEAQARQKLADAEAYRLKNIGKVNAEQMALEGALITKHPLLIQKTMADRLSDKVQVIIAPPHTNGFIGNNLLGNVAAAPRNTALPDDNGEQ